MPVNKLSWMIGGPQGSGINRSAEVFARACIRNGLHVFSNIEYHSNIMGRHSFYRVRVNDKRIRSHVDSVDLLLALDEETLFGDVDSQYPTHRGHVHEIAPGGGMILDAALGISPEQIGRDDVRVFAIPYTDLLKEGVSRAGLEYNSRRHDIMRNIVSVAASFALVDMDTSVIVDILRQQLPARRAHLVEVNARVVEATTQFVKNEFGTDFGFTLESLERDSDRMIIRGADAVGLGKLYAGCSFQTYYPIAPATEESEFLETVQTQFPITILQAEDEIACINMAVGAAHGGARAATSTAGPGFSMMCEGLGFAAMTEAPGPVVCLYQRGGPSTGLPTRHSQGDLKFALNPGHGDFPHIVVAPGDIQECFEFTFKAFNYGDKYQMPVIVLLDRVLANSFWVVDEIGVDGLVADRGELFSENGAANGAAPYKRHAVTESGVSPRSIPGEPDGLFVTTSDEHTDSGKISEGIENRLAQMDKRMRKLDLMASETPAEDKWTLHGPEQADATLVSWGSTKGAIIDAMRVLDEDLGIKVNFLQIRLMRPFPADDIAEVLTGADKLILIEDNYSGQLGELIREKTGIEIDSKVLKYDGRPISQNEVEEGVAEAVRVGPVRLVMSHP